jgi:inhibitor of cysteine peptidase
MMKRFTASTALVMILILTACAADPIPQTEPGVVEPATEAPQIDPPVATADPNQGVTSDDPTPGPTPTIAGNMAASVLYIDGIDILIMESFPVQIMAVVRGNFADGCTSIGSITSTRTDNVFKVVIVAVRPLDKMCTDALVPFEQAIPLEVYGLPKGKYIVDINGSTAEFELSSDNSLPTP